MSRFTERDYTLVAFPRDYSHHLQAFARSVSEKQYVQVSKMKLDISYMYIYKNVCLDTGKGNYMKLHHLA